MDCFRKIIAFRRPRRPEVTFCSERKILWNSLVSTIETKKMMRKGCQGYLAHVEIKSEPFVHIEDFIGSE